MDEFYALFRRLMVHDEVVLARRLLDLAPWDVRDQPVLADMRLMVNAQLRHLDDPEAYWAMYAAYRADVEAVPLPNPILQSYGQFVRFRAALELLTPGCTFLDIGSYDGALTNRAGIFGARAFGVDCSVTGVDLANRKAVEFNTGARHALCRFGLDPLPEGFPAQYDVVSCMEVYEHCPDPGALCRALRALVAPGGVLLLTTPHGSWLRGVGVGYGPRWDQTEPREHVRAPTPLDVGLDLRAAGFESVRVESVENDQSGQPVPIPGQSTLLAVAK